MNFQKLSAFPQKIAVLRFANSLLVLVVTSSHPHKLYNYFYIAGVHRQCLKGEIFLFLYRCFVETHYLTREHSNYSTGVDYLNYAHEHCKMLWKTIKRVKHALHLD